MEHLIVLMSMVKTCELSGEACVLTFLDIKKCFDTVTLSDMNFHLLLSDVDLKALKLFQKLTGKTRIRIQGGDKSFEVLNGEGQGGVNAARSCSAGITEVVERKISTHPCPVTFRGVNVATSAFVDDTMSLDKTAVGAKISGKCMTEALNEISLKAHDQKTVQICCGEGEAVLKLQEELGQLPTTVQGWNVGVKEGEKYLGVTITTGTTSDIVEANIKAKKKRIAPVVKTIRNLLKDPKIKRIGRLKAACLMIQGQVVPILLYGVECWLGITEAQYKKMEDIFRSVICSILSMPKTTPYEALLHEVGQYPMRNWIDLAKIRYFNRKLHWKQDGRLYKILRQEIIDGEKDGFMEEVRCLCKKYNLPDVTTNPIVPSTITKRIQRDARKRIWWEVLKKRKIPMIPNTLKVNREHHELDPMRGRLVAAFNCGALIVKKQNPQLLPRKLMKDQFDRSCLFPGCHGLDDIHHIRHECEFYRSKDRKIHKSDVLNTADFLMALDQERQEVFGISLLLNVSDWS